MVSLAFTGYNGVDRGACQRRRIHLYYVPGYSTDSVAELTVGLALSVLRKIPYGNRSLRKGYWDSGGVQPGTELTGKTVGILGTGAIGVRSAKIFNAFGCRIVGWSKTHKTEFPGEYRTELGDIFQEVDILVLHLPLNTDTEGIVNRERISLMRPGAILINTSRSGLVDTVALADAIHGYRIAGAGIDVFDQESEAASEDPLLVLKDRNVVATPHLGFKTTEALYRLSRTTIDNIGRYLRGDAQNRLEPEGKGS
jgi:D-3-phosphoglycerate dehydrogenase